jgi:adenosylmethionine-8-amino-7-oxononanoate aminotransferase
MQKEDPDTIAAMIIEPVIQIQGAMTPPKEYLPKIKEICNRHNVILIFDEIITGFGRTGKLFGAITFETVPDIIVCGKGMSGGYAPLSACLISDKIASPFWADSEDVFHIHGHTYGCHMLSAVAGIAAIQEIIEKKLSNNAKKLESIVKDGFIKLDQKYGIFGDIRGKGLIIAGEIVKNKKTKENYPIEMKIGKRIAEASLKNGLIQRAEPHWIAVAPPLVATESDIEEIFNILDKSIEEVLSDR